MNNAIKFIVVAFLLCIALPGCLIGCGGAAILIGAAALNNGTGESPVDAISEEKYWDSLAQFIEQHPERFTDTDRVFKIAEELKTLGKISSTDRLSGYRARMQTIDSGNRSEVVRTVRGSSR